MVKSYVMRRTISSSSVVTSCVVGFTLLCGSGSLIYPFGRDQGSYAYAGWVALEGGVPYRDVFALKPPMTIFVHSLAIGAFGVDTWAIRLLDVAWTAFTSLLIVKIAMLLWNRREVALGAGLTYPFLYYQLDYWNTAQTDGWMVLPMAAAVSGAVLGARVVEADERRALMWWGLSGALAGIAVLFKYTAVGIAAPMLVALGWAAHAHGRRTWLGVLAMALGGCSVLGLCWFWLVWTGAWGPFVDSQLGLVAPYVADRANADTAIDTVRQLVRLDRHRADVIPLFWAGPVALVAAWIASLRSGRPRPSSGTVLVVVWWFAAIGSTAAQGKFFDYHYLPLTAPAALLVGLGLADPLARAVSGLPSALRPVAPIVLLTVLIAFTPLGGRLRDVVRVAVTSQTMEDYIRSRREYAFPTYNVEEIRQVAERLRSTTTPDQRVFVWSFEPTINVRAKRHTVSRFLYNYPFRITDRYETELMEALRSRPPDAFVVRSGDRFPGYGDSYVDSSILLNQMERLAAFLRRRYELSERVGRYSIWRLSATPSS